MTSIDLAGGARLEVPEEPTELREGLRQAVLSGQDWRAGFRDDVCIGVWLWREWQPALEPAGVDRDAFVDTVVDARREVWLWLVGERPWVQFVTGLAGRISRRARATV